VTAAHAIDMCVRAMRTICREGKAHRRARVAAAPAHRGSAVGAFLAARERAAAWRLPVHEEEGTACVSGDFPYSEVRPRLCEEVGPGGSCDGGGSARWARDKNLALGGQR
jgi:hypothetical protein